MPLLKPWVIVMFAASDAKEMKNRLMDLDLAGAKVEQDQDGPRVTLTNSIEQTYIVYVQGVVPVTLRQMDFAATWALAPLRVPGA